MSGKEITIVGDVYRIPNTDPKHKGIILGNDQNFAYVKASVSRHKSVLIDTCINNGIAPCITRPTRITCTSVTRIDNYVNAQFYKRNCCSGIITTDMSDHFPIFVSVGSKQQNRQQPLISNHRKVKDTTFNKLSELLQHVNWPIPGKFL